MCALPVVLATWSLAMRPSAPASHMTLMIALLIASATDIGRRKIYNWTTYPLIISGIVFAAMVTLCGQWSIDAQWCGRRGVFQSMVGTVGCGLVTLFAYMASRGGAGDVKLAAGIGASLGLEAGLMVVAIAYILAAIFVLLDTVLDRTAGRLVGGLLKVVLSQFSSPCPPPSRKQAETLRKTVPLAGFFTLATVLVLVW